MVFFTVDNSTTSSTDCWDQYDNATTTAPIRGTTYGISSRGTICIVNWTSTCHTSSGIYRTWVEYEPEPEPAADYVSKAIAHQEAIKNTRKGWVKHPKLFTYTAPTYRPSMNRRLMCSMSGWLADNGKKMRKGHL